MKGISSSQALRAFAQYGIKVPRWEVKRCLSRRDACALTRVCATAQRSMRPLMYSCSALNSHSKTLLVEGVFRFASKTYTLPSEVRRSDSLETPTIWWSALKPSWSFSSSGSMQLPQGWSRPSAFAWRAKLSAYRSKPVFSGSTCRLVDNASNDPASRMKALVASASDSAATRQVNENNFPARECEKSSALTKSRCPTAWLM